MSAKRSYCARCSYPSSVCVCHAIQNLECTQKIVILQHPSEAKHAKNSARLLPLCLPNVQIVIGESPNDFLDISKACKSRPEEFAVFYPCDSSTALEENISQFKQNMPNTLIFIDATWRKAYKMWQLNPWLHQLSSWHFATPPRNCYQIRKASVNNSLSTLEAVAYALEQTQGIDCQPLHDTFYGMQQMVFGGQKNSQIKH